MLGHRLQERTADNPQQQLPWIDQVYRAQSPGQALRLTTSMCMAKWGSPGAAS